MHCVRTYVRLCSRAFVYSCMRWPRRGERPLFAPRDQSAKMWAWSDGGLSRVFSGGLGAGREGGQRVRKDEDKTKLISKAQSDTESCHFKRFLRSNLSHLSPHALEPLWMPCDATFMSCSEIVPVKEQSSDMLLRLCLYAALQYHFAIYNLRPPSSLPGFSKEPPLPPKVEYSTSPPPPPLPYTEGSEVVVVSVESKWRGGGGGGGPGADAGADRGNLSEDANSIAKQTRSSTRCQHKHARAHANNGDKLVNR